MKKTQILMNKPIYLGLPILELSKTSIKKLWYAYVNLKCGGEAKFCYMETDSFIVLRKIKSYL